MVQRKVAGWAGLILLAAPGLARAQPHAEVVVSPYEDAEARALAALDDAVATVDVAHYNIRSEVFHAKLGELRDRGVRVRIVVDAKNAGHDWNTLDDRFEADGFAIRRYENTGHAYAIMHHKFTVIDDAVVLTGSYNWNETAQTVNDENMLVLHDPALAAGYAEEFAELWGERAEAPGPTAGALGTVHFAPEDRVRDVILAELAAAQTRIRVAMFAFRDDQVARALADAAGRGVEVTLLTEQKQAETTRADERVANGGGRVIVGANTSSTYSAMHQKFAVIDDAVVLTGACNWTWTAFEHSNEDVLVLRDPALAERYTQAFGALVRRYDPAGFDPADYGIQQANARVQVLVRMPRTLPGESVWITGSHPALAQGLELYTNDSLFPSWAARVELPAGEALAWQVVVRGPQGERAENGGPRSLQIDAAGSDTYVEAQFRDLVEVTLSAEVAALPAGAELRITGADPVLGNWDPLLGLPLSADPAQPDRYLATATLPSRAWVSCKLVLVDADGAVTWEAGADRRLEVHDDYAPQAIDLGAFQAP